MSPPREPGARPLVVITGAAGDLGTALSAALADGYAVVGLDRPGKRAAVPLIGVDFTSDDSVAQALATLRERHGAHIASVVHLAAYFDFTGEDDQRYEQVNVEGTRRLVRGLQTFDVGQFVYAGTMLVHEAAAPGERIDESRPLAPQWAYPRSKAAAEAVIRAERGAMPCLLLHLAGVYDERRCVPTLAQQIVRIYERDLRAHLYAGDPRAGQAMLHKADMVDAFRRAVDRRAELPDDTVVLVGETDTLGYDELQDAIGRLVHGDAEWTTLTVPEPAARLGAALLQRLEPLVPDALDRGEAPFIRPFMVALADDHYALDISRAQALLGWQPRHTLRDTLPALVQALKDDPPAWYRDHGLTPPPWLAQAGEAEVDAEALRARAEALRRDAHARHLWAPWFNIALASWLVVSPPLLGLRSPALAASDVASGLALAVFAALALSWRLGWARWACAAVGCWVMFAPLVFWAPTAAGYLNDTLVGMLVIGLAVGTPPEVGPTPLAATSGPDTPAGWSTNPSSWTQRLPIIVLAFVGLHISRTLAAYQLGHADGIWEPWFAGGPDPKNGSEEIVTSSVSEAWPVPDAGLGAMTYGLEILTGVVGSTRRWRTMPWLVLLFGLMIVPLGAVSLFFIVIQPIWIGTWCTLCLVAAAAMLVQIPYSLDELLASLQFLRRRRRAGRPLLAVLLFGDTDDGEPGPPQREFERSPRQVLADVVGGGVNLPWNLALAMALGVWLMCTRLTLGADGAMANADHLVGALVITVAVTACAEIARPLRFALLPLALALALTSLLFDASLVQRVAGVACALALGVLALPRGTVAGRYGGWERGLY